MWTCDCLRAPTFHHIAKVAVVGAVIEQAEPGRRHGRALRRGTFCTANLRDTFPSAPPQQSANLQHLRVSYLYVAAGSHGRGDNGEVNCLHLANC